MTLLGKLSPNLLTELATMSDEQLADLLPPSEGGLMILGHLVRARELVREMHSQEG